MKILFPLILTKKQRIISCVLDVLWCQLTFVNFLFNAYTKKLVKLKTISVKKTIFGLVVIFSYKESEKY